MKKKIVIYTALIGDGYDNLMQPYVIDPQIDYICFTKKEENNGKQIGIWEMVYINIPQLDNVCLSRFPKLVPHKTMVSNYEYSLYIDANLIIANECIYERIRELIIRDCKLALIKHPARDCAYQEAYNCIAGCKARWRDLIRHIIFLKINHYPKHNGLYEANVIFRNHNDNDVIKLDELWWRLFYNYSKRDQLSLVYALWKYNFPVAFFLPPQFSTLNHLGFIRKEHLAQKESIIIKIKKRIVSIFNKIGKKTLKE